MRMKPLKSLAVSAIAMGAAAAGVASVAPAAASPLPQDPPPAPGLPTADQLSNLCTQATDPGVSYTTKSNLVQNGIAPDEGHVADHDLRKAYRNGNFPETFAVTNIAPAGPNMAQADVAISGPRFAGPVEKHLVFVNEGGNWILQHDAAIALIQAASATN